MLAAGEKHVESMMATNKKHYPSSYQKGATSKLTKQNMFLLLERDHSQSHDNMHYKRGAA